MPKVDIQIKPTALKDDQQNSVYELVSYQTVKDIAGNLVKVPLGAAVKITVASLQKDIQNIQALIDEINMGNNP